MSAEARRTNKSAEEVSKYLKLVWMLGVLFSVCVRMDT